MKRILCTILAIILVMTELGIAAADEVEKGGYRYDYTNFVIADLGISGTTASCYGGGRGVYSYTTTHIQVTLTRKTSSQTTWTPIASWTASASGTTFALVEQTHSVVSGYSYRVVVRCQIKNSDGQVLETAYRYSTICNVP